MFFLDVNGHALEFKAFQHDEAIFAAASPQSVTDSARVGHTSPRP
ncbi:MAG: hypothetical protein ACTS2F_30575 [Thainema sp.]